MDLDSDARSNLIQALLGLTVTEMENVLAKAAVRDRGFGTNTARLVLDEKRDLIRKTAALTFTPLDSDRARRRLPAHPPAAAPGGTHLHP